MAMMIATPLSIFLVVWLLQLTATIALTPKNIENYQRNNLCNRTLALYRKQLNVSTALSGLTLNAAININADPVYFTINNVTGKITSGLMYTVLQKLATSGKFTWNYVLISSSHLNSTVHEFKETLQHFDVFGDFYADNFADRSVGIDYTQSIVDDSLVLVTIKTRNLAGNLWNFLKPFSKYLWGSIALLIMVNTVMYFYLEHTNKKRHTSILLISFFDGFYQMWGLFTGGNGPQPSKRSTMMLNMGYFFFMFIMLNLYTATLTSCLIIGFTGKLTSMSEANSQNARICVLPGSTAEAVVSQYYPDIHLVVDDDSEGTVETSTLFQHLRDGKCDGLVTTDIEWRIQAMLATSNPDCNLVQAESFRSFGGSLPFLLDYDEMCTSLIGQVFNNLIVSIKSDGTLEDAIDNYLVQSVQTQSCAATSLGSESGGSSGVSSSSSGFGNSRSVGVAGTTSQQITIYNLSGVFVVYAVFVGLALIRWVYEKQLKVFKQGLKHLEVHHPHTHQQWKNKYLQHVGRVNKLHHPALQHHNHQHHPNIYRHTGVLVVTLSGIFGLLPDYLDRIVYFKLWTTTMTRKLLVCGRRCIIDAPIGDEEKEEEEEEDEEEVTVSASFEDQICYLDVADMTTEHLFVEIVYEVVSDDDDVAVDIDMLTSTSYTFSNRIAFVKIPLVSVFHNRLPHKVMLIEQDTVTALSAAAGRGVIVPHVTPKQDFALNVVLDRPHKPKQLTEAGEVVDETAMYYPMRLTGQFSTEMQQD